MIFLINPASTSYRNGSRLNSRHPKVTYPFSRRFTKYQLLHQKYFKAFVTVVICKPWSSRLLTKFDRVQYTL